MRAKINVIHFINCSLKEILAFCALALVCSSAIFDDSAFRIVNGTNVNDIRSAPAVVLLDIGNNNQNKTFCGGAAIGAKVVVTAGHCIPQFNQQIVVWSGSTDRRTQYYNEVATFFLHPLFYNSSERSYHDIAVIITKNYIKGAKPIAMATSEPQAGAIGVFYGWGAVDIIAKPYPAILQMKAVEIVDKNTCNQRGRELNVVVAVNNICAKPNFGIASSCHGDSGSPLVVNGLLVGLVSGGSRYCGFDGMFGVYTNIPYYRNWIFHVTRGYL